MYSSNLHKLPCHFFDLDMRCLSVTQYSGLYIDSYCTRYHVKTMSTQTQLIPTTVHVSEPQFKIAVRIRTELTNDINLSIEGSSSSSTAISVHWSGSTPTVRWDIIPLKKGVMNGRKKQVVYYQIKTF